MSRYTSATDADRHRFADATQVRGFFDNGVELTLTYEEAEQLPEPRGR